jgi:hypothetical protein
MRRVFIIFYILDNKKSTSLWRLPHFHDFNIKSRCWESNRGEGCQLLSSLRGWCLFLHGLLVMPIIYIANQCFEFILFTTCLTWYYDTIINGHNYQICVTTKIMAMETPLISCLYHLYHVGLMHLSSYVWSYFRNWLESKTRFPNYNLFLLNWNLFHYCMCNGSF